MNPELKPKLLDALRSGEYKQGRGQLRVNDCYCILGVVTDIYAKEHGEEWTECPVLFGTVKNYRIMGGNFGFLPWQVAVWAGFESLTGPEVDSPKGMRTLSALNDMGYTFEQLAEAIEKQL
jgi:hypothetical protein